MIRCIVEEEGGPYTPRQPYHFVAVPRIGEEISLEYDGDQFPRFRVTAVLHVPDNVQVINDDVLDAYVVLTVQKL